MKRFAFAAATLGLLATAAAIATTTAAAGDYSPAPPPEKLVTIFSNLGRAYPEAIYYPFAGLPVLGPNNANGAPRLDIATAFTVDADHTATKIQAALLYASGTQRADVALYTDNAGAPGTTLKTWRVQNLSNSVCCDVVTVRAPNGIKLHAGSTYWLVAKADSLGPDTVLRWAYGTTDEVHARQFAQYCSSDQGGSSCGDQNDKWLSTFVLPAPAFAVFGSD
ncbi:MAG: hypothetical protein JOZ72_03215 [Alphaproteobacteria bacterium]|nr:hypothetical protein [Alphaproteobacteria bacterium]